MRFGTELIKQTVEILKGNTAPLAITEHFEEVARGAAILDSYTNWSLSQLEPEDANAICRCIPNADDGYAALNAYVHGAIILANEFGTEDFYNYYSDYVDQVIIPAMKQIAEI